ncbi:unnamed protein product [Urochloa humidicola]
MDSAAGGGMDSSEISACTFSCSSAMLFLYDLRHPPLLRLELPQPQVEGLRSDRVRRRRPDHEQLDRNRIRRRAAAVPI